MLRHSSSFEVLLGWCASSIYTSSLKCLEVKCIYKRKRGKQLPALYRPGKKDQYAHSGPLEASTGYILTKDGVYNTTTSLLFSIITIILYIERFTHGWTLYIRTSYKDMMQQHLLVLCHTIITRIYWSIRRWWKQHVTKICYVITSDNFF